MEAMNGRVVVVVVVVSRVEGKHLTVQFEFSRRTRPDTTFQSEAMPYFDQLVVCERRGKHCTLRSYGTGYQNTGTSSSSAVHYSVGLNKCCLKLLSLDDQQ